MKASFASVVFSALLAVTVGAPLAQAADPVHPWDYKPRRVSDHRWEGQETNYKELYDYYYYSAEKSTTHALHSFHRRRYYNAKPYILIGNRGLYGSYGETDVYEFEDDLGRWVRNPSPEASPAVGSECRNYSFSRPNYRVPPFAYECQK